MQVSRRGPRVSRAQFHPHRPARLCHVVHGDTRAGRVDTRSAETGPAFALYSIMDFIVDRYLPIVDALGEDVGALEQRIFSQPFSRRTTARIYQLRRDLLALKRVVAPVTEMTGRLIRFEDEDLIPPQTRPYFRDVYDHTLRTNERIDSERDLLGTALEAHLSLVSVSQNEDTRRLAAWAAIFAVPTAIAGIYGMNFEHMPELEWTFGYPLVLAGIITACVWLYFRFKKAHWL
jgi:magnesium transporter